eukprot:20111-Heterococcus_DN1.PRE.1
MNGVAPLAVQSLRCSSSLQLEFIVKQSTCLTLLGLPAALVHLPTITVNRAFKFYPVLDSAWRDAEAYHFYIY